MHQSSKMHSIAVRVGIEYATLTAEINDWQRRKLLMDMSDDL